MTGEIRLVRSLALILLLSLTFASTGAAQDVVAVIDKQAWKIDPTAGSPAQGREKNFEMNRRADMIEVFRVQGKTVEIYLFMANDFLIDHTGYDLTLGRDGQFAITDPDRSGDPEATWHYQVQDPDTLVQTRELGTFVYKRVPDFDPPKDELTGLGPLPWQNPDN